MTTKPERRSNIERRRGDKAEVDEILAPLRSLNAELLGELKNAAAADEFYRHETSRSAYLREFAERARAIIARANQDQDSVAINSPALAEQPESKANAASWPGKKAKAKEQVT